MEAAVTSGVLKIAGDKLFSLLASEFSAITGVRKNLEKLQGIHRELEGLLSRVRDSSIENDPEFGWVFQLKDVAFDVGDLLYEVHLEAEKYKMRNPSGKHAATDILSAKPKTLLYRCKVARKIKSIQKKLAAITKQRSDMNVFRSYIPSTQPKLSRSRANAELSLLTNVEESEIPTRDQEKVGIISKLLESSEGEHGWIISIVGLGGSGKTTLAKHICHDNKIKEHFKDKIYWVHVSQETFNEENLINKVFEAITKEKSDHHTLQYMIDEISRRLTGEKVLLVFDDAWHQDKADWNKFMVHLKGHAPGSKLMVTTRDKKVAEVVKSEHIFNLACLPEVESWNLFLRNFGWKEDVMGSEFIQVGREIVNKCAGVPLAIKTIGGILSEKREISTWMAINQSDLWNVEQTENRVFASLKLSYIHLKDQLKECFVFCSIFPKGYRINKRYLIEQWIANGFIKQMTDEHPEVIGNEYFDLLVKFSFLQESRGNWLNRRLEYKMHDLIHDLTCYILQSEVTISQQEKNQGCIKKCRYLSLTSCDEKVKRVPIDKVRALCALEPNPLVLDKLVKKNPYISSVVLESAFRAPFPLLILKLGYLGYLEIHNVFCTKLPDGISGCWNLQSLRFIGCNGFVALPESIGKLKKLRNVELTMTDLESLPGSIGDCQDLQSLRIRRCKKFTEIPNTIGKNQNLRVLDIVYCPKLEQLPTEVTLNIGLECLNLEYCDKLVELPRGIENLKRLEVLNLSQCDSLKWMPSGIAELTALKRLDLYVVGDGTDDARISGLENLNMISGKLELKNLPHLMDSSDAVKACLTKKKNLQYLLLEWSKNVMEEELDSNIGVLDALEPPSHIDGLRIDGYRGSHLPCWMSVQSQSRFLCLHSLVLQGVPNLKHMQGVLVFPSLSYLELRDLPNLEEMWTTTSGLGIGDEEFDGQHCFPALTGLSIEGCPKLIVEPYFPLFLDFLSLKYCKNQLVSQGSSFGPLLACTSDHPGVDGPSIYNGALAAALHLKRLDLSQMIMSVSYQGFLQYHLPRLEQLSLRSCEGLTELPDCMQDFTSLKELSIGGCSNLMALPECLGELRSLETIYICNCPMMVNLPRSIGYLTSLRELNILECKNLKQLPDEIQYLTSLEVLWLKSCEALIELPEGIGKLSTLERLHIESCPALRSLPSSIQHLTSLQRLEIWCCPELYRRYKKEVGDDWHLISHVPGVSMKHESAPNPFSRTRTTRVSLRRSKIQNTNSSRTLTQEVRAKATTSDTTRKNIKKHDQTLQQPSRLRQQTPHRDTQLTTPEKRETRGMNKADLLKRCLHEGKRRENAATARPGGGGMLPAAAAARRAAKLRILRTAGATCCQEECSFMK